MNKPGGMIWNLPFYFFVFLGLFVFIKFVFIFFFRAAFEPQFIFELTPFYILSGINSLQLLFLSLIVVAYDTYLHMQATRKNILRSFIPTAFMLCGLGLGITNKEISISSLAHYILFGLLLFIILIDHRRTLIFPEMLPSEKLPKPSPFISKVKLPFFAKHMSQRVPTTTKSRLSLSAISSLFSIFKRGKKAGAPEQERKITAKPKSQTSMIYEKEKPVQKSESKEKSEIGIPPQDIELQKPQPAIEEHGGVSGPQPGPGIAKSQSTPQTVGTVPYYKDQIHPGAKPKLSPSIITSIFGKRKKAREPERRATIPVKSQAISSPKEDQTDEQLNVFKEKPLDEGQITQELKKETEEAIFPVVSESTEYAKEGEKQRTIEEEVEKSIVTKQDIETKREGLKDRQKEIEDKITIFKDLQTNYKNIQSGLDSLKNELENICKDLRFTEQDSKAIEKKYDLKDLEKDIEEKTLISPYKSAAEEILKPKPYSTKWKMAEKRKRDIRKAKIILNELEGKIEKLERIYIK